MNKRTGLLLTLALTALALLSCGGSRTLVLYEGERRPAEQVAVLDVSHKSLYVMGIDTLVHRYRALSEEHIEVLPGEHTLVLNYSSWKGTSDEPMTLSFEAQAGHLYQVKASAGYRRWTAWIIDMNDGSVVAGSPPD
ncbi:MAG TPA: hypothetical protein PKW75_04190 [candidate division Zixibacteria bacterium]|nr:hypothetical protein [candidate division Zixibacteria bacterium]MDD4917682.1 hypothetical protein [candidate division Zixibacteria bacterium]MDM7974086.1 hypothetical protein [candidate division Zixibacteria bacterium]HOD65573.1 hypothetical protein [candidate division Zixibacteria bacterium]HOZ07467.1 hypothetical protein [candidate division Zixibacteria bacterium]